MAYTLSEKVRNFAFISRVSILLLQMVANWLIPDHNADAFVSPPDPDLSHGWVDTIVDKMIGGLVRWDAQYFIHIAEYGYTHENTLAFFPFFPLLLRFLTKFIVHIPLQFVCNYHTSLILTAVFINFYLFVKTSVVFYKLSREVLRNEVLAYRAALLFCVNPASIFFTAPYSESLFAFTTFSALLSYEIGNGFIAPLQLCLAAATRSNGLLNVVFVVYHKLQHCSTYYYRMRRASSSSGPVSLVLVVLLTFNYTFVPITAACCCLIAPFVLFQAWCYMTYCGDEVSLTTVMPHLESFLRTNFLHSPDLGEAEWCYATLPLAYTHVQDKYWEVGLFRYYEARQLPNFLLAVPAVMLTICHAALYLVDNPEVVWSLGIPHPDQLGVKNVHMWNKRVDQPISNTDDKTKVWCSKGLCSWRLFVYTAHGLAVCFFCLLFVNVQVTTRLVCSSCPVVYWFSAHLLSPAPSSDDAATRLNKHDSSPRLSAPTEVTTRPELPHNMERRFTVSLFTHFPTTFWGQVVLSYYLLYFLLGTVLFCNFLPWT